MTIQTPSNLLGNFLSPNIQKPAPQGNSLRPESNARGKDIIQLSGKEKNSAFQPKHPHLLSESTEKIENGFRRIQTFANKKGQEFTRTEEFTTTTDRTKRIVIQQNSSGSTTILENILDRQNDGSFRLTQRFTDEIGATKTNIEFDIKPNNADILLGRAPIATKQDDNPFRPSRGTEFDISV